MAEKCRTQFSSSTSTTNSSVTSTTTTAKNFLNTVEIQIIPQKPSSNQNLLQSTVNYSSVDKLEESSTPIATTTTTLHDIISDTKSSDVIIESSSSSSSSFIADDEIIREEFYETILKDDVDDGDDESRTNSTTNNDDDDDNIIEQSNQLLIEREQHDNVNGIYLETPIVDENNICMNVVHDYENTKPKRISDDFFSSDDGDDGPSIVSSSCETNSIVTGTAGRLSNVQNDENSIENFLQVSSREYLEEEEDTNSSLCSNLMNRLGNNSNRNNESHVIKTTTTTSSSSITSDNLVVLQNNSDKKLNINDSDTHPTTSSKSTLAKFYHDHDVQSMDAIERRDFEHEQILTGGVIIKASSLVNSDDKINLEFIKSYKESGSNSSSSVRRSFSDSKSSQQKDHSTTPTSSRRSSIRLTKSAPKINLSATLDRLEKKKFVSTENTNEHENLACSGGNNSSIVENIRGESSSSVLPSSSTTISLASSSSLSSTLPHYSRVTKFDMFLNSNSNDSLSSDKSYNTSSNHSLRNFFNKSNGGENSSNNNELFYVSASDDVNNHKNHSSKAIRDNQKILEDNDTSSDQGVYSSEPIPSTSRQQQHSPKCHYSNFCCDDNIKTTTNIQKDDISTVLKNSKDVASKLTFSDRKNTPSTSSNTTPSQLINREICSNYNIEELYPNVSTSHQQQSSLRQMENHKFEERTVEGSSSSSHMPTVNSEHIENEFDDETWADCEEGSDEEICTCHNNDYPPDTTATEDDLLPSRDVDLSGYIQMVSISEDMFLQDNNYLSEIPSSVQRKRKLNDNRVQQDGESPFSSESSNGRKRIAFDCSSTPRSSQQYVSTVSSPSTPMERRTPRSLIPTKDNPPPELQDWLLQFQRWSHAERLLAVDRLIEHCEPTQVRHMMKVIEPQFQRDFISLLPKELALQVLSYLEPKDLLRAAQTCRSWRFLCDDNLLWKEKCRQAQIIAEPKTDRPKRGRAGNMPPISSPWKAAYMRQHIIEMNWRSRPIRQPKILKGHDDHVITCLQFSGNRIVSGSDDNTLKVWSAVTGKCLRTLVGHTGGVWSSQMSGNIIISGSTDRTLKVWNMETGQCIHTLLGHTSTVRCMHLHGKKVVSGSRDATLRVWDIEQGTCLHVLVGHLAAVRCVQYDGKLIVSGAYDYMVKVWHPERQECLHTLQGHTNRVYSLQFDGIHVVSGSLDTSIRVWDAETGNCKHTLMGHQSLTSGMELRQNILVSGNADSTVKVWDITTGQCLQTLSGPNKHQSAVTCLQFNSRFVITSSDDGTVKLWDVKTGEFIRNLVALESGGSGGVVWRIRANDTKLICAVGSRNGTEETKLMVLDFDVEGACLKCS